MIKLCTLMVHRALNTDPIFVTCMKIMFLPLTSEDYDAMYDMNLFIDTHIGNDTYIAKMFIDIKDTKYLFVYRIISMLYEQKFDLRSPLNSVYVDKQKVAKLYTLIIKLTIHISFMKRYVMIKETNINNRYNEFIYEYNPVEIYVKKRNDKNIQSNPRYILNEPIQPENKNSYVEFSLEYYNSPYRVGTYRYDINNHDDPVSTIVPDMTSLESKIGSMELMYSNKLARYELGYNIDNPFLDYNGALDGDGNEIKNHASKEKYMFGKITGFIDNNNKVIPTGILDDRWKKNITANNDIIIIGYGQSGSGKTSSLVHLSNHEKQLDTVGIIPELLNKLDKDIYVSMEVTFIDIYLNWKFGKTSYKDIKDEDYLLRYLTDQPIVFTRIGNNNGWGVKKTITDNNVTSSVNVTLLSNIILKVFDLRETEPTENNPQSSRSHVLVSMVLKKSDGTFGSKIVLCDLAGVENEFSCSLNKLILLDAMYRNHSGSKYNKIKRDRKKIYFDRYGLDDTIKEHESYKANVENTKNINQQITMIRYNIIYQMFVLYHILADDDISSLNQKDQDIINDLKTKKITFDSLHIQEYVENQHTVDNVSIDTLLQDFIENNELNQTLRSYYAFETNMGTGCVDQINVENHFIKIINYLINAELFYKHLAQQVANNNGNWLTHHDFLTIYEPKTLFNIINAQTFGAGGYNAGKIRFTSIILFHYLYKINNANLRSLIATPDRTVVKKINPATNSLDEHNGKYFYNFTQWVLMNNGVASPSHWYPDGVEDENKFIRFVYNDSYFNFDKSNFTLDIADNEINTTDFLSTLIKFKIISVLVYHDNNLSSTTIEDIDRYKPIDRLFAFNSIDDMVKFFYDNVLKRNDLFPPEKMNHIIEYVKYHIQNTTDILEEFQADPAGFSPHEIALLKQGCDWFNKIWCTLTSVVIIVADDIYSNEHNRRVFAHCLALSTNSRSVLTFDRVNNNTRDAYVEGLRDTEAIITGERLYYNELKKFYNECPVLSKKLHNVENLAIESLEVAETMVMQFLLREFDIHTVLDQIKIEKKQIFYNFLLYEMHMFNCRLRRNEGYFINQSLIQLKSSVTQFLVRSMTNLFNTEQVQNAAPQVIMFAGSVSDGCWESNFRFEPLSLFNYPTQVLNDTLVQNPSEIIMKLLFSNNKVNNIQGLGLLAEKTKINVFTVINMNDNENEEQPSVEDLSTHPTCNVKRRINNNPPTPPYINTNVLKRFVNESKFLNKIENYIKACKSDGTDIIDKNVTIDAAYNDLLRRHTETTKDRNKNFMERIRRYDFYSEDDIFNKMIDSTDSVMNPENPNNTIQVINYIETNNETTFIGTLNFMNFTTVLKPDGLYPICDGTPQYVDIEEM